MKLAELRLVEFDYNPEFNSAHALSDEQQASLLTDAKRLGIALWTRKAEPELLALFKAQFGSHDIILLTKKDNQKKSLGYIQLSPFGKYWIVEAVILDYSIRGGVDADLYAALRHQGYKLRSGNSLTDAAVKTWKKLGAAGLVKTLDAQTGQVLDFDNQSELDNIEKHQGTFEYRYHWVLENSAIGVHSPTGQLSETRTQEFLDGARPTLDEGGAFFVFALPKDNK